MRYYSFFFVLQISQYYQANQKKKNAPTRTNVTFQVKKNNISIRPGEYATETNTFLHFFIATPEI